MLHADMLALILASLSQTDKSADFPNAISRGPSLLMILSHLACEALWMPVPVHGPDGLLGDGLVAGRALLAGRVHEAGLAVREASQLVKALDNHGRTNRWLITQN